MSGADAGSERAGGEGVWLPRGGEERSVEVGLEIETNRMLILVYPRVV